MKTRTELIRTQNAARAANLPNADKVCKEVREESRKKPRIYYTKDLRRNS